jgi:hypothetical protein
MRRRWPLGSFALLSSQRLPSVARHSQKAFLALHAAQLDYHGYLDQIQDTGTAIGSLPHVFISGLGSARDCSGTFMYGIKDFIDAGYLSSSDMPKVLTQ